MAELEVAPLPPDLVHVRDSVEEYVRARLKSFAKALCAQITPSSTPDQIMEVADNLLITAPSVGPSPAPRLDLHLVFRHECLALGCRDGECTLCQFNPSRLCERNFGKKYLVGDALKAKCGASIKVELVDSTGQRVEQNMNGVHFEVNLVDGVLFKEKGGENRILNEEDLKACFKLTNHKDEALLQHKNGGLHRKVVLKLEKGHCLLPDLQVTDSSEALLTGRRPPFRLLVWAVRQAQDVLPGVHYAVSEEFVVATRRVKQANKADIPLVDDHVSKIEHIGRETVKKLQDLRGAASEVGVDLNLPEHLGSITTVGQFRNLVELADKDIQMRKILQIILKLSKEKWDEAANHTLQAVKPDFRKRVWYPAGHHMGIGLLFNCKYGAVQLKDPVALVQLAQPGGGLKLIPEDQLDPSSLHILRQLKAQAVNAWWTTRHPGWGVFREASDPHAALPTTGYLPSPPPQSLKPVNSWHSKDLKPTMSIQPSGTALTTQLPSMPLTVSASPGMTPHIAVQQTGQLPLQIAAPMNATFAAHIATHLTPSPQVKSSRQIVLAQSSSPVVTEAVGQSAETQLVPVVVEENEPTAEAAMEMEAVKTEAAQQQPPDDMNGLPKEAGGDDRPPSPTGSQANSEQQQEAQEDTKTESMNTMSVPQTVIYYVPSGYFQGGVPVLSSGQQHNGQPLQGISNVMVLPGPYGDGQMASE